MRQPLNMLYPVIIPKALQKRFFCQVFLVSIGIKDIYPPMQNIQSRVEWDESESCGHGLEKLQHIL